RNALSATGARSGPGSRISSRATEWAPPRPEPADFAPGLAAVHALVYFPGSPFPGHIPMTSRRAFVASAAGFAAALPGFRPDAIARALATRRDTARLSASALADDEDYWAEIQRAFDADRTMINLNNGGVCPTPTHVLEAMIRDLRFSNELPVHHMWDVLEPRLESVRRDLAADFGCDPEEMAITRNASEAMETLTLGIDLEPGDEVLVTTQNYPRMLTTWDQRERRDG